MLSRHPFVSVQQIIVVLVLAATAMVMFHNRAAAQVGTDEPFSPGARQIFVPALEAVGDDGSLCATEIVIQNVGVEPSKAIVLFWGEPGACGPTENGPMRVECTGLLNPGIAWRISGPMIPAGARSAIVYSATTKGVNEADPELGIEMDDTVADWLCESLFFDAVGDAAAANGFRRAVEEGAKYLGLRMERALGARLSVTIDRECNDGSMRYVGITSEDDSDGAAVGGSYDYVSPMLAAGGGRVGTPRMIAMNTGLECATISVFARRHLASDPNPVGGIECPTGLLCGTFTVAPGETLVVDPISAACLDADGSAWIRSDQPLAVVVDGFGLMGRLSAVAEQASWSGARPGSGSSSSRERVVRLSAPLVYHDFNGWSTIVHVANSTSDDITARLTIWDRGGAKMAVGPVDIGLCALGGRAVALDEIMADVPENFTGTVSVEAVSLGPVGPGEPIGGGAADSAPEALSVTIELVRRAEDGTLVSSAAYDVRPAAPDMALIGVPSVVKHIGAGGNTVLAIHNQVRTPGFTDFTMYFYDESGLVDYVCQKLGSNQVDYVDIETWGYVNSGFSGSAVISAKFWEHVSVVAEGVTWNDVSLGAVVMEVPSGVGGTFAPPTDPKGSTTAVMLPSFEPDPEIEFEGLACPGGSFPGPPRPRMWRINMPLALRNR